MAICCSYCLRCSFDGGAFGPLVIGGTFTSTAGIIGVWVTDAGSGSLRCLSSPPIVAKSITRQIAGKEFIGIGGVIVAGVDEVIGALVEAAIGALDAIGGCTGEDELALAVDCPAGGCTAAAIGIPGTNSGIDADGLKYCYGLLQPN